MTIVIRGALASEWPVLYPIFAAITAAGQTYAYPDGLPSAEAEALWMGQGRVVVAELDGEVVGTATMGPNRAGRGAHIATGSFMVSPAASGRGAGRRLGEHLVEWTRRGGLPRGPVQRRGGDQRAGRPAVAVARLRGGRHRARRVPAP